MTTTPDDLRGEARDLYERWRRLGVSEQTALDECRKAGLVDADGTDRAVRTFRGFGLSEEAASTAATVKRGRHRQSVADVIDGAQDQRDLAEARQLREKRRRRRARSKPVPASRPVQESKPAEKPQPEGVRVLGEGKRARVTYRTGDAVHSEGPMTIAQAERRARELRGAS